MSRPRFCTGAASLGGGATTSRQHDAQIRHGNAPSKNPNRKSRIQNAADASKPACKPHKRRRPVADYRRPC